jgi:hypothetical protein
MVIVEKLVKKKRLAGETEVLGAQRHFVHKSRMTRPGIEPGPPRWEANDKTLISQSLLQKWSERG